MVKFRKIGYLANQVTASYAA